MKFVGEMVFLVEDEEGLAEGVEVTHVFLIEDIDDLMDLFADLGL